MAAMDRAGAAENILRPSGALKSGPRSDLPLTLEYGAICSAIPTSDQPVRTVSEQIMVLLYSDLVVLDFTGTDRSMATRTLIALWMSTTH